MHHEEIQFSAIRKVKNLIDSGSDPYPEVIEIHPTDICNQRCDYCFHGGVGYDKSRAKDVMAFTDYERLFSEMKHLNIKNLSISGGGEPFLDNRLGMLIESALANGLNVRLVTNGNYISNKNFYLLSKIEELRVSLDAINPFTYASIRKVKAEILETTLENLLLFINYIQDNNKKTKIGVTFLVNNQNVEEAFLFCKAMLNIKVNYILIKYDIYGKYFIDNQTLSDQLIKIQSLNSDKIELREEIESVIIPKNCFVPFFKVAFNPYGELYSCCLGSQPNEKNGYFLGNLKISTFKDLWSESFPKRVNLFSIGVTCVNCNHTDKQINTIINNLF